MLPMVLPSHIQTLLAASAAAERAGTARRSRASRSRFLHTTAAVRVAMRGRRRAGAPRALSGRECCAA